MQGINKRVVQAWVENLNTLASTGQGWSPSFWKPFHLASLAAQSRCRDGELTIEHEHLDYAVRMGIFEAVGQEPPFRRPCRPANGRFVEARAVSCEQEVQQAAIETSEMFKFENGDTREAVSILLSELLGNCCAHSADEDESPFGLVCGQSWPQGDKAQFCIADTGIGIRESLNSNEQLLDSLRHRNACELAVEYGVTGKPHGHHSGYGLALAKGLAEYHDGRLIVLSGSELYCNLAGNESFHDLNGDWQGTLIIFEWPLSVAIDVGTVYDNWPRPDGMEEDEYDELFD